MNTNATASLESKDFLGPVDPFVALNALDSLQYIYSYLLISGSKTTENGSIPVLGKSKSDSAAEIQELHKSNTNWFFTPTDYVNWVHMHPAEIGRNASLSVKTPDDQNSTLRDIYFTRTDSVRQQYWSLTRQPDGTYYIRNAHVPEKLLSGDTLQESGNSFGAEWRLYKVDLAPKHIVIPIHERSPRKSYITQIILITLVCLLATILLAFCIRSIFKIRRRNSKINPHPTYTQQSASPDPEATIVKPITANDSPKMQNQPTPTIQTRVTEVK